MIVGLWFVLFVELAAPFLVEVLAGADADASVPVLRMAGASRCWRRSSPSAAASRCSPCTVTASCWWPTASPWWSASRLTLALVPSLEARGAAIGTTAAEFTLALMSAALLARARAELRPPLAGPAIALLCALPAAAVVLIPGLHEVARAALATVVYFGALTALGRVPQELLDAIPRPRPAS